MFSTCFHFVIPAAPSHIITVSIRAGGGKFPRWWTPPSVSRSFSFFALAVASEWKPCKYKRTLPQEWVTEILYFIRPLLVPIFTYRSERTGRNERRIAAACRVAVESWTSRKREYSRFGYYDSSAQTLGTLSRWYYVWRLFSNLSFTVRRISASCETTRRENVLNKSRLGLLLSLFEILPTEREEGVGRKAVK